MIPVFFVMVIWAVLHSLLASRTAKAFARRFGERAYYGLYRAFYNFFAFITLAPILYWVYVLPGETVWRIPDGWQPVLIAIQLVGVIAVIVSLIQIDIGRFAGYTQLRVYLMGKPLPLPDEPLQIGGLYSVVRHPLYLFSLMAIWPLAHMTDKIFAFNVAATLYFMLGSLVEEGRLVAAFGDSYVNYRRKVAWLIPLPRLRR